MYKIARPLLVSFIVLVAACSATDFRNTLQIESRPVSGVDLPSYSTWRFAREDEYPTTGIPILDDPKFRDSVGKHTVEEMQKIGYTHVDKDPDFVLMLHVVVDQKFDEQKMNDIYQGYDMAWAQMSDKDYWKVGSLMLFAMDAKTGKQIWSSVAQARLDERANYDTRLKRFKKVISLMLEDFPKRSG